MNQYKPNWNVRTYSKDEFIEAWESSVSVAECIKKLGLRPHGGQHKVLNMTAENLGLKKDHMLGQGANSGKNHRGGATPIPLSEILAENSGYNRYNLKRRLIKEGLLEERCQAKHCPSPVTSINGWTGEVSKTPLTLDHINGINNDNRVENLRLVCANCDRYSPTFSVGSTKTPTRYECENRHVCSKHDTHCKKCLSTSISQNYRMEVDPVKSPPKRSKKPFKTTCFCGGYKTPKAKSCSTCHHKNKKRGVGTGKSRIKWPPIKDLVEMTNKSNYSAVARELGVSNTAVRKRIRDYS